MTKVIGIVFFLIGCVGVYWTGKRSFERRNVAGMEEFESYGKAVGTKALEGVISLIAKVLIFLGFLMFCMGWIMGA